MLHPCADNGLNSLSVRFNGRWVIKSCLCFMHKSDLLSTKQSCFVRYVHSIVRVPFGIICMRMGMRGWIVTPTNQPTNHPIQHSFVQRGVNNKNDNNQSQLRQEEKQQDVLCWYLLLHLAIQLCPWIGASLVWWVLPSSNPLVLLFHRRGPTRRDDHLARSRASSLNIQSNVFAWQQNFSH